MDKNRAAASAEVKELEKNLNVKIAKARARNTRNARQMASDLRRATTKLYGKMAAWQTMNRSRSAKLSRATSAAATASRNALSRAKKIFASKMSMLTNVIAANAKRAQRNTERLTGVAFNIANAKDRQNIRDQTKSMQADMNKVIVKAQTEGVA